jgi:hypothetical protein
VLSDETLEVRVRGFYSDVVTSLLFARGLIQRAPSCHIEMAAIRIPCKGSYQDIQAPFSRAQNNILQAQYVDFLRHLVCLNRKSRLKVRQAYWKKYLEPQRKT